MDEKRPDPTAITDKFWNADEKGTKGAGSTNEGNEAKLKTSHDGEMCEGNKISYAILP